jgi:Holliday junction resolvasome RuvABC DNA-binding subunit
MSKPITYVNLQDTQVSVIDPKGVHITIFPYADRDRVGSKGITEVSGDHYAKYVAPRGPLSPKPETHKPFRDLSLPDLDPRNQATASTLLPVELAQAIAKSKVALDKGDPARLHTTPVVGKQGAEKPTVEENEADGSTGLTQPNKVAEKSLEAIAGPLTEALNANGIENLADLAASSIEVLVTIPGINETTAQYFLATAIRECPPKSDKLSKVGLKDKVMQKAKSLKD